MGCGQASKSEGHGWIVSSVAGLGDGRVVSGSFDKTVRIWGADGECERYVRGCWRVTVALSALWRAWGVGASHRGPMIKHVDEHGITCHSFKHT